MTNRFADQLVTRSEDAPPPHASTLLRGLGVINADHATQTAAVQSWLDQHPSIPWLLAFSLRELDLPDQASRAA